MNKPYLLIAGDDYYPCQGTYDWIARFATREEAREQVTSSNAVSLSSSEYRGSGEYIIKGKDQSFDWYEIVNLETWEPNNA